MWEENFIKKYNEAIERYHKAEQFLQSDYYVNKRTGEKIKYKNDAEEMRVKEKWIPDFHKLIREISRLQTEYKDRFKKEMTYEERIYGFKC